MTQTIEVDSVHDLTWLIDIANDMRKAKKDSKLSDLPESTPQDQDNCLIANAFNYGCSVDPGSASINFQTVEDRETYEKIMIQRGYSDVIDYKQQADEDAADERQSWEEYNIDAGIENSPWVDERTYSELPQILCKVAELFDAGAYDKYTEGYWQSDGSKDLVTLADAFEVEILEKDEFGEPLEVDLSKVP